MTAETERTRPRLPIGRFAVVAVALGLVAMWIYVLTPSSQREAVNRLDSPAFGLAAEPVCAAARTRVDALPRADTAESPADRADLVTAADEIIAAMLDDLATMTPGGRDGEAVALWLADWRTYLADRERWASELRGGADDPFLETAVGGGPISEALDDFATVNDMPSCAVPRDV